MAMRIFMFFWSFALAITGGAFLWGAAQAMRDHAQLFRGAFIPFLGVTIAIMVGSGAIYGAYRLLLATRDDGQG